VEDRPSPVRTLVVRCRDWPVVAAGHSADEPVVVVHANRVVATSPAARAEGVARGQRRREAQGRCPSLVVLDHDPDRDARVFEPVAASLDAITPRVELTVPGQVAFPTRGPSRFFGGDAALVERTLALVREVVGPLVPGGLVTCSAGIADGTFAATLAARTDGGTTVEPGGSAAFLAPLPLRALDRPELVDVLGRLGLHTMGDLAALPGPDVLARFGVEGHGAWRLASGLDERPPATEPPPADLSITTELDPPADTVPPAAFVARGMAAELYERLNARGMACTRIVIGAETEHGERLERVWRADSALTSAQIADRLRWQLDGWISGSARHRPTAGISRLWLIPEEIVPAGGRQLGFWGTDVATADRATRAVARVQGLLGIGSVTVPEWRGSRDPATQIALIDVEAVDLAAPRPAARRDHVEGPWPGRLPTPSPARVHPTPTPADVVDDGGQRLAVTGRGVLSAPPARLSVAGGPWADVVAWAGPWPLEERWWDLARARRRARLQLVTADGRACLAVLEQGQWHIEATYD
jgi:protein ImuB